MLNEARVKIARDDKTGLWFRPDLGEESIIREQTQYDALQMKGKVVMDCGANLGAFTSKALVEGACKVHAYEPVPATYKVLVKNHGANPAVILNNVAITGSSRLTTELYLSKSYPSCHTTRPVRGRDHMTVSAVNFWKEVERIRPQVVKIDVEGAEYDFMLRKKLPHCVQQLAIELHLQNEMMKNNARAMLSMYSGWYVLRPFKFNWHVTTTVLCRRKPATDSLKVSQML